jgi:hypothetical protein
VADQNVITTLMPRPLGLSTGGRRLRQSDGQPLLVQTRIASPNPGTTQETLQRSLDSGSLSQQLKQLGWSIASAPARVGVRRPQLKPRSSGRLLHGGVRAWRSVRLPWCALLPAGRVGAGPVLDGRRPPFPRCHRAPALLF